MSSFQNRRKLFEEGKKEKRKETNVRIEDLDPRIQELIMETGTTITNQNDLAALASISVNELIQLFESVSRGHSKKEAFELVTRKLVRVQQKLKRLQEKNRILCTNEKLENQKNEVHLREMLKKVDSLIEPKRKELSNFSAVSRNLDPSLTNERKKIKISLKHLNFARLKLVEAQKLAVICIANEVAQIATKNERTLKTLKRNAKRDTKKLQAEMDRVREELSHVEEISFEKEMKEETQETQEIEEEKKKIEVEVKRVLREERYEEQIKSANTHGEVCQKLSFTMEKDLMRLQSELEELKKKRGNFETKSQIAGQEESVGEVEIVEPDRTGEVTSVESLEFKMVEIDEKMLEEEIKMAEEVKNRIGLYGEEVIHLRKVYHKLLNCTNEEEEGEILAESESVIHRINEIKQRVEDELGEIHLIESKRSYRQMVQKVCMDKYETYSVFYDTAADKLEEKLREKEMTLKRLEAMSEMERSWRGSLFEDTKVVVEKLREKREEIRVQKEKLKLDVMEYYNVQSEKQKKMEDEMEEMMKSDEAVSGAMEFLLKLEEQQSQREQEEEEEFLEEEILEEEEFSDEDHIGADESPSIEEELGEEDEIPFEEDILEEELTEEKVVQKEKVKDLTAALETEENQAEKREGVVEFDPFADFDYMPKKTKETKTKTKKSMKRKEDATSLIVRKLRTRQRAATMFAGFCAPRRLDFRASSMPSLRAETNRMTYFLSKIGRPDESLSFREKIEQVVSNLRNEEEKNRRKNEYISYAENFEKFEKKIDGFKKKVKEMIKLRREHKSEVKVFLGRERMKEKVESNKNVLFAIERSDKVLIDLELFEKEISTDLLGRLETLKESTKITLANLTNGVKFAELELRRAENYELFKNVDKTFSGRIKKMEEEEENFQKRKNEYEKKKKLFEEQNEQFNKNRKDLMEGIDKISFQMASTRKQLAEMGGVHCTLEEIDSMKENETFFNREIRHKENQIEKILQCQERQEEIEFIAFEIFFTLDDSPHKSRVLEEVESKKMEDFDGLMEEFKEIVLEVEEDERKNIAESNSNISILAVENVAQMQIIEDKMKDLEEVNMEYLLKEGTESFPFVDQKRNLLVKQLTELGVNEDEIPQPKFENAKRLSIESDPGLTNDQNEERDDDELVRKVIRFQMNCAGEQARMLENLLMDLNYSL